jgi:UDP-glucose 4-epimerase
MHDVLNFSKILLTGGAGYIGSHTFVALRQAGYLPVILDNFSNSHPEVVNRLARITGIPPLVERGDVGDRAFVRDVLIRHRPVGIVHFAGDKAVGESVKRPLKYFKNNLGGAISLLEAIEDVHLTAGASPILVFSSSATVYGDSATVPISEDSARSHTNPYGLTKLMIEDMLSAVGRAQPAWKFGVLRYFNPVGAHASGLIGEDPAGVPNNLMPYVAQVAVGQRPQLQVFGGDYPTPDGTGIRDYIHVQDLADGHVAAIQTLLAGATSFTVNLGTGYGYSVLDVIRAFEEASGRSVPFQIVGRRPGDVASCYADPTRARRILGWRAKHTLAEMCADAWRWQRQNPLGFADSGQASPMAHLSSS